jgi:cytochrome subunit of sulfide dehydrogenase
MMKANKIATLAAALMLASAAAVAQPAPEHVRSWAAGCANCHGTNGQAQPGLAALAGVPAAATVAKMQAFKSGALPATLMHQISKGYSDEQIQAIAAYFAAQKN